MGKIIRRRRGAVAEAKAAAAKLSPRDKKTMGSIVDLADNVVTAAEKRRDPHVDIPSRTLANVHYSPRKRIIEMGNSTNRRQLFDLAQAKAYMRTMLVASGCKKLLEQGKTISIRGMYYMLKHKIAGTTSYSTTAATKSIARAWARVAMPSRRSSSRK
jgi:DNA topoisomerase-6 subunit A